MAISAGHKANLETLKAAFEAGDVALLECTDAKTGLPVIALCAVNRVDGEFEFAPFAKMFDGNPYEELMPPNPEH